VSAARSNGDYIWIERAAAFKLAARTRALEELVKDLRRAQAETRDLLNTALIELAAAEGVKDRAHFARRWLHARRLAAEVEADGGVPIRRPPT